MSKNIRQKIAHAIQTTFRSSSSSSQTKQPSIKSKIASCCSVPKPQNYEYISYQPKTTPSSSPKNDYVDLSECHSWSLSCSRDSGISFDTNISSVSSTNINAHPLQSTRTHADDSYSLSTLSDLSCIPHEHMNISQFDVTAWHAIPSSFECCQCQCHHHINDNPTNNYLYVPEAYRQKRTKNEIFPFIL